MIETAVRTYGRFDLSASGLWTYTLNNGSAAVQGLKTGQIVTDSFTAFSVDGTDSQTVTVSIAGRNDAAVMAKKPTPPIQAKSSVRIRIAGRHSGIWRHSTTESLTTGCGPQL